MRQGYLIAPRALELRRVETPISGPGEVLVRVRAALTCGTDLKTYRHGHARLPFGLFGHEGSGEVMEVGAGVDRFKPGDAVVWTPTAPCKECPQCQKGRENLCRRLMESVVLGTFADFVLINAKVAAVHLFHKPSGLRFETAAFTEPLACVIRAWRACEPLPGESVLILGGGTMAMLHLMEAKRRGLRATVAVRSPQKASVAQDLGASEVVAIKDAPLADLVIEATGSPEVWSLAPMLAEPGGKVLFYSGLTRDAMVNIAAERVHYEEVALIGAFHYTTQDAQEALRRLAEGEIDPEPLITERRRLDRLVETFEDLDQGRGAKYAFINDD